MLKAKIKTLALAAVLAAVPVAAQDVQDAATPAVGIGAFAPQPSLRYPPYEIQSKRNVKVAVRRRVSRLSIQTPSGTTIYTPDGISAFKGNMQIEISITGQTVVTTINRVREEMPLPCTLYVSADIDRHVRVMGEEYRGTLIITPDDDKTLKVVNVLDIEDYLRGVIPLKIGDLGATDIEAVKAQAVATRTTVYQKLTRSAHSEFDFESTMPDLAYGGVNAEGKIPDLAIRLTKDLVMVHDEQLINAYYHSICGGITANVEDALQTDTLPYLRSKPDTRPNGQPYCGGASKFAWTETWTASQMSKTIKRYAESGQIEPIDYRGGWFQKFDVREIFECGRVKTLRIEIGQHRYTASGDKIRYLLRGTSKGNPILRSALITDISADKKKVTISGRGHGHGVGMCQVGAINRAREGQSFEDILKAYYTDVTVRTAVF